MENNNTNTDYHKFIKLGDQKWEIAEITIIISSFFFLAWDLYSLLFIQGVFKSHLKKITPTYKVPIPPKIQFDLSPSYINILKNVSAPAPAPQLPLPRGRVQTMVWKNNIGNGGLKIFLKRRRGRGGIIWEGRGIPSVNYAFQKSWKYDLLKHLLIRHITLHWKKTTRTKILSWNRGLTLLSLGYFRPVQVCREVIFARVK